MRVTAVVFLNAVTCLVTKESANSFSEAVGPRYGGYKLTLTETGVVATHPTAKDQARLIPFQNIRWFDCEEERKPRGARHAAEEIDVKQGA